MRGKASVLLAASLCLATCFTSIPNVSYAQENNRQSVFGPGDVNGDGQITLDDAALALNGALKITTLEEEAGKAADLRGDGQVTVDDAQNILLVALKVKTMEDVLGTATPKPPEGDYVEKNVTIDLATDKESYKVGETIGFTAQVKNTGATDVPLWGQTTTFGKAGCILVELLKNGQLVSDSWGDKNMDCSIYTGKLQAGENLVIDGEIMIPDAGDTVSSEAVSEQDQYTIRITMQYKKDAQTGSRVQNYTVEMPVAINK